jgi:hypothetical protein
MHDVNNECKSKLWPQDIQPNGLTATLIINDTQDTQKLDFVNVAEIRNDERRCTTILAGTFPF